MALISRDCPVCHTAYLAEESRLKFGRQTTCSRACSYQLRAKSISKSETYECSNCGKEFSRSPSQVKSKHKSLFCSKKCQYEGRSKGLTLRVVKKPYEIKNPLSKEEKAKIREKAWESRRLNGNDKHSEKTKLLLSSITSKNIATGKISRVSKIEFVVKDILESIGVDFSHQYGIRDKESGRYLASVDFYLPGKRIAIEVNGTFWHADPRFYKKEDLKPSQQRTLSRYSKKEKTLKAMGIKLVEIWEYDLLNSIDETIDYIRSEVS